MESPGSLVDLGSGSDRYVPDITLQGQDYGVRPLFGGFGGLVLGTGPGLVE